MHDETWYPFDIAGVQVRGRDGEATFLKHQLTEL